jgi:adenosine kinase
MNILVSGSLAYDKIMTYPGRFSDHILPDKIHTMSVSFVTENLSEHFGGTAGSISYNLAMLGEHPTILAAAGNDFGPYRDWLEHVGVELELVRIIPDQPTAFATIMTDRSDNQITALYLGTMAESCKVDAEKLPTDSIAIIAPGNADDMRNLPGIYRAKNIPFVFDPGQQVPSLSAGDLRNGIDGAKALIVNDYELSLVIEKTGWDEEEILKHAEILAVTLGENGSRIRTAEKTFEIPVAATDKVLDPTGAGDAYRGGFLKGLIADWPLGVTGRFAAIVAAYAIEAHGPQGHKFTAHEARTRYAENFGEELPS